MNLIVGHGIDVVKIDRVDLSLSKKILTKKEREIFDSLNIVARKREFMAGRFAAKEAFFKALGTGIRNNSFLDISILNDGFGKPFILVEKDFKLSFNYAYVSISHDFVAVSSVILEKNKGGVIADSTPDFCEMVRILDDDFYELDCDIPPFELQTLLKKQNIKLIKYGNIWEAIYFEY